MIISHCLTFFWGTSKGFLKYFKKLYDFRWFSMIFRHFCEHSSKGILIVLIFFGIFWVFVWCFFRFPLDKSWHFNVQKNQEKHSFWFWEATASKKIVILCIFDEKVTKRQRTGSAKTLFSFFLLFFQQLTSSGISIKTSKKERKKHFFSILAKSGLFWRNPLAIPLFYVEKIMKSDSLLLP